MITLMKALPELAPGWRQRLFKYADQFRQDFRRRDQARWVGVYLQSLLAHLEHSSRPYLPHPELLLPGPAVDDPNQALQNFINQSPWEETHVWRHHRALMRSRFGHPLGVFVLHDLTFPKQGSHSVGVQRQFSTTLGKKVNCQIAVAVHYVSPAGSCPLALRLYLPRSWLAAPHRLQAAGVPVRDRLPLTRGEIALHLLDEVRQEGFPGAAVVAGTGFGNSPHFRAELAQRAWPYLAEVPEDWLVFPTNPTLGQPTFLSTPRRKEVRSVSLRELAQDLPLHSWKEGTSTAAISRFGWTRVWHALERPAEEGQFEELGLLVEEEAEGTRKYACGRLSPETKNAQAMRLWNSLHLAHQDGREMKEILGLDQFQGRSWRGFHHHACLVMVGYGFLICGGWEKKEG